MRTEEEVRERLAFMREGERRHKKLILGDDGVSHVTSNWLDRLRRNSEMVNLYNDKVLELEWVLEIEYDS